MRRIGVDSVVNAVERAPHGSILFGSTGTSGALFSSFDYGHPANILDHLVALRVSSVELVDDDSCRASAAVRAAGRPGRATASGSSTPRRPRRPGPPRTRCARVDGTRVERVGRHYFVVRTTTQLAPRALIRRGVSLRLAWKRAVPSNHRVDELLLADRELLRGAAACVPYGELGDPDISPHWPPVTTTHQ